MLCTRRPHWAWDCRGCGLAGSRSPLCSSCCCCWLLLLKVEGFSLLSTAESKKSSTLVSTDLSAREGQQKMLHKLTNWKRKKRFLCISSPSVQFILSGLSLPFTHKIDFNWKSPQELTADNMIEIVTAGLKVFLLPIFSFLISIWLALISTMQGSEDFILKKALPGVQKVKCWNRKTTSSWCDNG